MVRSLGGALLVLLGVMSQAAAAGPITVQSLTYEGSGCPPGSVSFVISPVGSDVSLLFDSHFTEAGTRECTVSVVMEAPPGWSWAIVRADHRGFAFLPAGASATLKSSFQFNRQTANQRHAPPLEANFLGPLTDDYFVTADTPPLQIDWSKCGGTSEFHIKTRLEIDGAGSASPALLSLDSLDGSVIQLDGTAIGGYRVVWRRCD